MQETPFIPETEFEADRKQGLNEMAEKIARSGLTISALARATRCHWETVYHAANGIPVRYDNARRLAYFLDHNNNNLLYEGNEQQAADPGGE